jgi:hypothetical protein
LTTAALIVLGLDVRVAYSQSLGDVARREADRRKDVAAPGRTYTNEDLGTVDAPQPAPQPAAPEPKPEESAPAQQPAATVKTSEGSTPGTAVEEDPVTGHTNIKTTVPARVKRDEPYWRARFKEARGLLAKANADLATAQARLEAIDAGPQTPATAREREVVAAAVARIQTDIRYRQEAVTKLQTQASLAKVPPEWTE